MSSVNSQLPLKRKRGRPRKNPANSSIEALPFNRHGEVISLTDDTPPTQPMTQTKPTPTPRPMAKQEPELSKAKPKLSLAEPFLETPAPTTTTNNSKSNSNNKQNQTQLKPFESILASPPPSSPSQSHSRYDLQIFVDPPKASANAAASEEMPPPQTPRRTTTHATLFNELSPFNPGRYAAVDPSMLFHEFISTSPLLHSSAFLSSPLPASAGWSPKGPSTPKTFASIMQSSPLYQGFYSSPVQSNSPSNVPRLMPMSLPSKRQRLAGASFPKLDFESLARQRGAASSTSMNHDKYNKHHVKRRKLDLKQSSSSAARLVYQSPDRLPNFAARSGGVLGSPRTLRSSPMRSPMSMSIRSPMRTSSIRSTSFCPDKMNLDFKRGICMSSPGGSAGGSHQHRADENRPASSFVTPRKRTLVPSATFANKFGGGFTSPSPSKYSTTSARSSVPAPASGKRRISLSVSETGKAAVNFGFSGGDRFGGPVVLKQTSGSVSASVSVLGDIDLQTQNLDHDRFESSDDEDEESGLKVDVDDAKAALTSSASKLRWKLARAQLTSSSAATTTSAAPTLALLMSSPSAVSSVSSYGMDQFSVATPMTSPMRDRLRSSPRSISSPYRKLHNHHHHHRGQHPRDLANSFPAVTPRRLTIAHGDDSEGETDIEEDNDDHNNLSHQKGVVSKQFRTVVDAREAFHRAMLSSQVLSSTTTTISMLPSIKKEPLQTGTSNNILRTYSSFGHELEFDLDTLNTTPGAASQQQAQPQVVAVTQFEDLFGCYETSTF